MRISGLEFTDARISEIQELIARSPSISSRSLSREACKAFGWRNPEGKLKEAACRIALHSLNKSGVIVLPSSGRATPKDRADKARPAVLPPARSLCCSLDDLGEVGLEVISSRYTKASRIWKEMMDAEHYLGSGPLCGAQLRYLVHSSIHGYVGALSFSSASWTLKAREKHIGWSDCARTNNLQKIINNSRFLIRPTIQVPNLASHVLGLCARQIGKDWSERYGVEPILLETFVDPHHFKGTCYKAANWINIGKTSGRRGRERISGGERKDIYLYPLQSDWQRVLCEERREELQCKQAVANPVDWVEDELSGGNFYDPRLSRRLLEITRDFYGLPLAKIPQSCGNIAKTKAAYRFFNNKRVTMERVLQPHIQSTIERIKDHKVVLSVQDTSSINYANLTEAEGLGPIGSKKASGAIGLLLHDTMAFIPEGVPLGLLDCQLWAREKNAPAKTRNELRIPIEQKESNKWLVSYRATAEAQKLCPETRLISVGDRESDIYELFHESTLHPDAPGLLIRCASSRNRKTGEERLWERMQREAVAGHQVVAIPRRGSQPKREATLEIRYARISLTPPQKSTLPAVKVWMVYARENPEETGNATPLEWMLLTTEPVNSFEDACERIGWYAKRWGIEIYHRTLKSGCRIEDRQLGSAKSLETCIAVDMVVAWRIYHLTMLGRETPELPCTVFFKDEEWKALYSFANKTSELPKKTPTLWEATLLVAALGGFLGRKSDGNPGTTVMWRGIQRLDDITEAYRIFSPTQGAGP